MVLQQDELVTAYRDALIEAGYVPQLLVPVPGRRRLTKTREAFEAFAQLRAAPEVLAVLATFSEMSGLRDQDDFSVSCLPASSLKAPLLRMSAIKLAWTEVLVVEASQSTGRVSQMRVWAGPKEDLGWVRSHSGVRLRDSSLDGGGTQLIIPGASALDLLQRPDLSGVIARRVAAMRSRRKRYRREDWHNRWLWALVDAGAASPPVATWPDTAGEWDVSSDDAVRLLRQRTSQQAFRRKLLEGSPQECAICGLDVVEVLEAVHLVPHARGGRASSENGRLLCANHHRAFDARLYRWTGEEFIWVGGGEEPMFGKGERR